MHLSENFQRTWFLLGHPIKLGGRLSAIPGIFPLVKGCSDIFSILFICDRFSYFLKTETRSKWMILVVSIWFSFCLEILLAFGSLKLF